MEDPRRIAAKAALKFAFPDVSEREIEDYVTRAEALPNVNADEINQFVIEARAFFSPEPR